MRDTLPTKPRKIECAVLNLDSSANPGTHWVAYVKKTDYCEYFDSFGDLKPPLELQKYLKSVPINYNYMRYQTFGTINCGHLCLKFLNEFWRTHLNKE